MPDGLPSIFVGKPLLEEPDGGLPSAAGVEIADRFGDNGKLVDGLEGLTEAGIVDDVFEYLGPLGVLKRLDNTVVGRFPVDDDGTEEPDEPPNGPLGESDERPSAPVEVEIDGALGDLVKLDVTLNETVDGEIEPGIPVEIEEMLEDSTETDEENEFWPRESDVKLDRTVVDGKGLDVPVEDEPKAEEEVVF